MKQKPLCDQPGNPNPEGCGYHEQQDAERKGGSTCPLVQLVFLQHITHHLQGVEIVHRLGRGVELLILK